MSRGVVFTCHLIHARLSGMLRFNTQRACYQELIS